MAITVTELDDGSITHIDINLVFTVKGKLADGNGCDRQSLKQLEKFLVKAARSWVNDVRTV